MDLLAVIYVHVDHKVAGGKLLRVDFEVSDGVVSYIRIAGDFFVHPEEGILEIERGLTGIRVCDVGSVFDHIVGSSGIRVVGFDGMDLGSVLLDYVNR